MSARAERILEEIKSLSPGELREVWQKISLVLNGARRAPARETEAGPQRREDLGRQFRELADQWKRETFFLSSLNKQYSHPAYVKIIAMGKDGLPFVLRELQQSSGRWFYALKFMAPSDVAAGIKGFEEAKAAWLEWGRANNYV